MLSTLPAALRAAPSARSSLARAVAVSLALAAVTGVGLAAASAVTSALDLRDTAVLAGYLVGLYGLVNLAGNGALALALLALGLRPGVRVFLAASAAFYVLLNGALRFILVTQLLSVTPFMTAVGLAEAVALVAITLLAARTFLASSAGDALRWGAAAALLLGALWGFQVWHERPHERDLARLVPPLLEPAKPAAEAAPAPDAFANAKLVVLGFDGITWEILLPLLRRGELPHFRALLEDSAYGYLRTLSFAISPVVWETISTGQPPARHGIGYHQHFEFPGMRERLRAMPSYTLCNTPMGMRRLLSYTTRFAPWRGVQADATDARVARFWEIASRSGLEVGVYNWLNTGPAVPLNGFLHAYGTTEPLDFPPDLNAGFPPLEVPVLPNEPGLATIEAGLPYEHALYRRFVDLALRHQPDVLMYYTHFADAANHLNWKQETVGERLFFGGFGPPDVEPGPTMTRANRLLDEILGDVLARVPADATVAVVSDHGFGFRGYEHDNGPPGVVIVRGPGVSPGLVEGADIADVTPTLLHLLGLPVADDMTGRVLPIARAGGPLERPPTRVASYGPSASRGAHATGSDPEALERQKEYLRSLGYVY
jgi:hypothetical protein